MKKGKLYKILVLFLTFMKIGALSFGGGYGMIPIINEEVSKKHKWISELELLDILAISESTPGPIAVNAATYVGYKVGGIFGAIFATLGLAIPPFIIIFIISFFYKDFIQLNAIKAIFSGLKVGVIILLISATLKLSKNVKKTLWGIILFIIALCLMLFFTFFNVAFDYLSICLIALGIIVGIVLTILSEKKEAK